MVREEFEKEIVHIHDQIIRMGAATQAAITDAVDALVEMDPVKAKAVIDNDDVIDQMERDIDRACVEMIIRQQPVAADLRDAVSTLKLITDLERIADHASDICEKVLILESFHTSIVIPADVIRMSDYSRTMIKSALEAYITKKEDVAASVVHMDDKVDALYDKIKAYLISRMRQDPASIEIFTELLLICKYFERISDHAQNVAEWVIFLFAEEDRRNCDLETVIVLVEDDPVIAELIEYNLRSEEYVVRSFRNGKSMIDGLSGDDEISLFILDIMLPGMDGFEICKWVRSNPNYPMTPVIMLTARSSESDKVHGLEVGADDYITKPFGIREFLARVGAQVRRYCASLEMQQGRPIKPISDSSNAKDQKADAKAAARVQLQREESVLVFSGITLDDARHRVFSGEREIEMTNREYELLKFLMKNRGIAFSRDDLLNSVWGFEYSGETRTVDVHIRQLRKKIEKDDAHPTIIETVRGRGYRFKES